MLVFSLDRRTHARTHAQTLQEQGCPWRFYKSHSEYLRNKLRALQEEYTEERGIDPSDIDQKRKEKWQP